MTENTKNSIYKCKTCGTVIDTFKMSTREVTEPLAKCPECGTPTDKIESYFLVCTEDEKSLDIKMMEKKLNGQNSPPHLNDFYELIDDANLVIKTMNLSDSKSKDKKRLYIDQLLSIARIGLIGENPNLALAQKSLDKLKNRILINEGAKIKNRYFSKLGIAALSLGIFALILGIIVFYFTLSQKDNIEYNIHQYFYVFVGAMAGGWISFGVRKMALTFDDLCVMEEDRLSHVMRMVFIGVVAVLFMLFLNSEIMTLAIGELTVENIMDRIELQILIGAIAGLVGNQLATRLYNIASEAVAKKTS